MKIDLKTSGFNTIEKRIEHASSFAIEMITQDVLKHSNLYIPLVSANLRNSGIIHTSGVAGFVIWGAPYAERLYYGVDFFFTLTYNDLAGALWFEAAKMHYGEEWVKTFQKALFKRI